MQNAWLAVGSLGAL